MRDLELTVEERMALWLNHEADEALVPDQDRQRFIDALSGTLLAAKLRHGFTLDDFAASGTAGRLTATLVFGWRPRAAERRAELIDGLTT